MRVASFLCLFASCLLIAAVPARAEAFKWETDLAKAQETANSKHKPVLLLFTGSTWCGVCVLLEKNILSTEAFRKFAAERLIAVKIDFKEAPYHDEDEKAPRVPKEDKAKIELAKKFNMNVGQDASHGLNGYPSVFILSADGARLGQMQTNIIAVEKGAAPFLKELEKMISSPAKP